MLVSLFEKLSVLTASTEERASSLDYSLTGP